MVRVKKFVLSLFRVFQPIFRRVLNSIKQAAAVRKEPTAQVWVVLAVALALLLLTIWWQAPEVVTSLSINLLAGAIGGIVGVYFSLEVVRPYVRTIERQRIDRATEILETYENIYSDNERSAPNFISFDTISAWEDKSSNPYAEKIVEYLPDFVGRVFMRGLEPEAPIVTLFEPSEIRSMDSFSCISAERSEEKSENTDDELIYTVPERLGSLLEPYEDDIRSVFLNENRTNELKIRLDDYRDDTFVFSKTTYYRSFLTNFCPDYPPGNETPIRELTAPLVFGENGDSIPLSESPFSNHFGGGGLVVTTDGEMLVSVRGKTVAVEGNSKHLSFSGSFDYETVTQDSLQAQLKTILRDETKIDPSNVVEICMLGVTRRIERLGKPDLVTLILVDENATWEPATDQFLSLDAVPVSPQTDLRIDSINDLFTGDRPYAATRNLINHLDERAYPPSLGLLSTIYLINSLADSI